MRRGVILVHVLILVAMMAFMASVTLKWVMSRHIAAKMSVESNEDRALLFAAQARVYTCLDKLAGAPNSSCDKASTLGCMGALDVEGRLFNFNVCKPSGGVAFPCRIVISLCPAGSTICSDVPSC